VVLFFLTASISGPLLVWLAEPNGYLAGISASVLLAAIFANWLALRIWENLPLVDVGLWWKRESAENLVLGLLGGAACAVLVLGSLIAVRAGHFVATPADRATFGTVLFVGILLIAGAMGEELFFRGFGFQVLLRALGPFATVLPVGILFALLHQDNPNASPLGLINTAAFGIVFGYAYLRSRDLWLPIGLHLGWNISIPLFGVNLSGLRMKVTGYELVWTVGDFWSGGEYGPEASIVTSVVVILLAVYLWKVPIRRQPSPLTDPPGESPVCEPSVPLS